MIAFSFFDLTGPEFLWLYVELALIATVVTVLLALVGMSPAGEPSERIHELTPMEVAYLAGGPEKAVDAALASLVHEGRVEAGPTPRTFIAKGPPPRLVGRPAGQALRHLVHEGHPALRIGGDDRVTDAVQDGREPGVAGDELGRWDRPRHLFP